jgi:uncharacterized protein (DUF305 family)
MTSPGDPSSDADDAADAVDDRPGPTWSWARIAAVVAVATFFGGAVGYYLGTDRPPGPSSVEVGFYRDMQVHHDQAVEMALLELANGENPTVRSFAQEIVIFQRWEMGRIHEQLLAWGADAGPPGTAMAWMGMPVDPTDMPGLASDEQMARLRDAQGVDADALFLDLMAEHHRGGAEMAAYAAKTADDRRVRALATAMARNQAIEIAEFRQTVERFGFDVVIDPYDPAVGAAGHHMG